jgi:hypothetical protein
MKYRKKPASAILLFVIVIFIFINGCEKDQLTDEYSTAPRLIDSIFITSGADTLSPSRIMFYQDSLFVSYDNRPIIDVFNLNFEKCRTIYLSYPEDVFPTSFDISDSNIFVADYNKGAIAIYNRSGKFQNSFGLHSDGETRLSPFALRYFGGVLYVSDIIKQAVMAISVVNAGVVTEIGEHILDIPSDTLKPVYFGSTIYITFDGRLIAGDANTGEIKVYTCIGSYIYPFDSVETAKKIAPQAIDLDYIRDPDLKAKDSSSFDPSGIRNMGRIHVVDANNNQVHMFNPIGKYISSYPEDKSLSRPMGIAIDNRNRKIFITDSSSRTIKIFKF